MGILSASCSFTRFKITEPVPKELWMEIPAKLRQFAFQDIDDIAEERGWGWTSFEDMLDTVPESSGKECCSTGKRRVPRFCAPSGHAQDSSCGLEKICYDRTP